MDKIVITFPIRTSPGQEILPDVHMEDWLAIVKLKDNIPDAPPPRVELRSVDLVRSPVEAHYISLCSSKSSNVTATLLNSATNRPYSFVPDPVDVRRWCIMEHGANRPRFHRSPSYEELEDRRAQGKLPVAGGTLNDLALVACFPNQQDTRYRALIAAGVRGIGTWGAVKYITRKWERKVDDLFEPSAPDFFQLLDVTYSDWRIESAEPHRCTGKLCT